MREILILDTETSGLDPKKDHLIEVGLVRWSVEHRTTLEATSWLVQAPGNPAEAINGIPPALLVHGRELSDSNVMVSKRAANCDAIAAHGDFDRQWFPELGRPWIDTAWDVDWPRALNAESRKVHALCLAHGLAVLDAHRALPDCQLLARLLERVGELGHDVSLLLDRAMRPKVKVLSLAPFQEKEIVKQHGFRWNPEERVWWRMMPSEDLAALPFRTRVIGSALDKDTKPMRAAAGAPSPATPQPPERVTDGPAAARPSAPDEAQLAAAFKLEGELGIEMLCTSTVPEMDAAVEKAKGLYASGKLFPRNVDNLRKIIKQHYQDIRDGKLDPLTMPVPAAGGGQ